MPDRIASTQTAPGPGVITRERYDAVLFDLDGVLTDTAQIHASSWKRMFDEYLRGRARRIDLPEGSPQDAPGAETVCGLGNRKNDLVDAAIAAGEVVLERG